MTHQIIALAKAILGGRGSSHSLSGGAQVKPTVGAHNYGLLFDSSYYCGQVPGLKPKQAIEHFVDQGYREGICPHPLFNTNYYLEQFVKTDCPDDPLLHFMTEGWRTGKNPHPLFDVQTYLASANNAFDQNSNPLTHFLEHGWQAGFDPHCLVSLSYCVRVKRRKSWKKYDPLSTGVHFQFSPLTRPHPLFDVNRIVTQLKFKGKPVDTQSIAREFAEWDASTSPSSLFDQAFYLNRNPEAADYPGGPFWHFVRVGQFNNRDPNPYFSSQYYCDNYGQDLHGATPFLHYMTNETKLKYNPCDAFNIAHYGAKHPRMRNTGRSLLEHFLSIGRYHSKEIVPHVIPPFLLKDVHEAGMIDPALRIRRNHLLKLPVIDRHQCAKSAQIYELLCGQLEDPFRVLVLVPFLGREAATFAAANLIKSLHRAYAPNDVLLLLTDTDEKSGADILPPGTRRLTLSDLEPSLKRRERDMILLSLLQEFRPEICYNINSLAGWDLFANYGRGLSQLVALCAYLFDRDFPNPNHPEDFAASHFSKAISFLSEVYCNSHAFRQQLKETLGISPTNESKLKTLYQPMREQECRVDTEQLMQRLGSDESYRRQVYWMGKPDRHEDLDILVAITRRCPEMDFHVYATNVSSNNKTSPNNVSFHEQCFDFFHLVLSETDMFLYTSTGDGLSQVLIDAMYTGIPIVAANEGGISELVNSDTGWLVPLADDVDAYVSALKDIANNSAQRRQRITSGYQHVSRQHSFAEHNSVLRQFQESLRWKASSE